MPTPYLQDIENVVMALEFDKRRFGWLGNRVIEAVIYLRVMAEMPPADIAATLRPLLLTITRDVGSAVSANEILDAKWRGRGALRQAAGLKA